MYEQCNDISNTTHLLVHAEWGHEAALPPEDLCWGLGDEAGGGQDLGGQDPGSSQHGPAAVDHLAVLQPGGGDEAARAFGVQQT